jgi:tetratricopeptide (TPR) repeat protein
MKALSIVLVLILGNAPSQYRAPSHLHENRQTKTTDAARDLIFRQKYDEAINAIEAILESNGPRGEAQTYLAAANLYRSQDFSVAKKEFEEAFKAGGGASFIVSHSHEDLSSEEMVDYCRGWLHLRKDGIAFIPYEGNHGFQLNYSDIIEFKQNRFSKRVFHIKVGGKNQNFRGRTPNELEPLLILALYRAFARG